MEKEIEFVPKYFTHIICRMGKVICVKTVHVVGKREYAKTICQTLSDNLDILNKAISYFEDLLEKILFQIYL